MSPSELFANILQNINPDEIPLEYIIMAKVTDFNGEEFFVEGQEDLARVMRGPNRKNISNASLVLNVRRIRDRIAVGVNEIYDAINKTCQEEQEAAAEAALEEARAAAQQVIDEYLRLTATEANDDAEDEKDTDN